MRRQDQVAELTAALWALLGAIPQALIEDNSLVEGTGNLTDAVIHAADVLEKVAEQEET